MGEVAEKFEDGDELDLKPIGGGFVDDDSDAGGDAEQFADIDAEQFADIDADEGNDLDLKHERAKSEELTRRLAQAEEQLSAGAKAQRDVKVAELKEQENSLEKQRMVALDEDDTEGFNRLDRELREATFSRVALAREAAVAPAETQAKTEDSFDDFVGKLAPAARSWVQRNRGWFDPSAEEYDSQRARRAERLATQLEGRYERNDPALYSAIDKQLRRQSGQQGARVAGVSRGADAMEHQRSGNAPLSRGEKATMRKYGLDNTKSAHVRAFRNRNADLN